MSHRTSPDQKHSMVRSLPSSASTQLRGRGVPPYVRVGARTVRTTGRCSTAAPRGCGCRLAEQRVLGRTDGLCLLPDRSGCEARAKACRRSCARSIFSASCGVTSSVTALTTLGFVSSRPASCATASTRMCSRTIFEMLRSLSYEDVVPRVHDDVDVVSGQREAGHPDHVVHADRDRTLALRDHCREAAARALGRELRLEDRFVAKHVALDDATLEVLDALKCAGGHAARRPVDQAKLRCADGLADVQVDGGDGDLRGGDAGLLRQPAQREHHRRDTGDQRDPDHHQAHVRFA